MRFRSSSGPPPYWNRRDQRRMLLLVGLLALVLLAMKWASRPESWQWIAPPDPSGQDARQSRPGDPAVADFGNREELKLDEFRSPARPPDQPGQIRPSGESSRGEDDQPAIAPRPDQLAPGGASLVSLLARVEDRTVGIRHQEGEAFYVLLKRVGQLSPAERQSAALRDVTYTVLTTDPQDFRGKLLTIEGRLKRLVAFAPGENAAGLNQLYDGWVFTRDSGSKPYRVVSTRIPAGIPEGMQIRQDIQVRATGYFFKLEGYLAPSGAQIAPVLLAHELEWLQSPPAPPDRMNLTPYLLAGVGLITAALVCMFWRFKVADRSFSRGTLKRVTTAPREAIDALADIEPSDPTEIFRRLAEEQAAADAGPAVTAESPTAPNVSREAGP